MSNTAQVFPPALVPLIRERCASSGRVVAEASDAILGHLLTTVFFAGMETHEGERAPVRVVFVGRSQVDLIFPKGQEAGAIPIYAWKTLRFLCMRPLVVTELVKLAVATTDERVYIVVRLLDDGSLGVGGLAREGIALDDDPFFKLVAGHPGRLSVRSGRDRIVEYERGMILAEGENVVIAPGPIRTGLEAAARGAGLDDEMIPEYLKSVRALVSEMVAHGHGGILVIYSGERPELREQAPYRMVVGSSVVSLLRLSKLIGRPENHTQSQPRETLTYRQVLRSAFISESERMIEEIGALTAIDGATLLNRDLALVAFGAILPVSEQFMVRDATTGLPVDLGSRGTRHRASAVCAGLNPGSVVFVASEDGAAACMLRSPDDDHVTVWRMGVHS